MYYCIVYVNLIKDRSSLRPPFTGKADAKVRTFKHSVQTFAELFSKFFRSGAPEKFLSKSGCKGKGNFPNRQTFRKFFSKVFSGDPPLGPLLAKGGKVRAGKGNARNAPRPHHLKHRSSLSGSGCKSTAFTADGKRIQVLFFKGRGKTYAKGWYTGAAGREDFHGKGKWGKAEDTSIY